MEFCKNVNKPSSLLKAEKEVKSLIEDNGVSAILFLNRQATKAEEANSNFDTVARRLNSQYSFAIVEDDGIRNKYATALKVEAMSFLLSTNFGASQNTLDKESDLAAESIEQFINVHTSARGAVERGDG